MVMREDERDECKKEQRQVPFGADQDHTQDDRLEYL